MSPEIIFEEPVLRGSESGSYRKVYRPGLRLEADGRQRDPSRACCDSTKLECSQKTLAISERLAEKRAHELADAAPTMLSPPTENLPEPGFLQAGRQHQATFAFSVCLIGLKACAMSVPAPGVVAERPSASRSTRHAAMPNRRMVIWRQAGATAACKMGRSAVLQANEWSS